MSETKPKKTKSQIGKSSRMKGKVFERTVVNMMKARGFEARRGVQFNGLLDHDVRTNLPFNFECKAVEKLDVYKAFSQAVNDCGDGEHPIVVHKKNHKIPLATMKFEDFLDLLQWATGQVDTINGIRLEEFWIKENKEDLL